MQFDNGEVWKAFHRVPLLRSLSIAHPAVSANVRADLVRFLPEEVDGTFLLTTCLRVEMVSLTDGNRFPEGVSPILREDEEAFLHLCRVAAGLESPVAGEPEVLGQFRQALTHYRQGSAADPALVRFLEAVVGVARRARRLLGDEPGGSLAGVAAQMAQPYEPVAILGSGTMARAIAARLDGKHVSVFARRSMEVGGRAVLPWDEADRALRSFPVVIATYPGKAPLTADFRSALRERTRPLLLIDLGMPPAFVPGDNLVRYIGIDELADAADSRPSPTVDKKLKEDAQASWRRLVMPARAGHVIAAMTAMADRAADEELARFAQRIRASDDPEHIIRQLARTVARRVVHPPIAYLGSGAPEAAEVLAQAFGIDRD